MRLPSTPEQEEFVGLKFLFRAGSSPDVPLFVLIHGRAGNVGVMWAFERCLPPDAAVVAFEAYLPDEVGGMSWWEMGAQAVADSEKVLSSVRRVSYAVERLVSLFQICPTKSVFLGFSQGAALISTGLISGELQGSGFALLSGFVPRCAWEQTVIHGVPSVLVAHGTQDPVIPVARALDGVDQLKALGLHVEYVEDDVEHRLGIQGTRKLKEWCYRVSDS